MKNRATAFFAFTLFLSLSSLILVEAQTKDAYSLNLQGPTWDHSVIEALIVPSDGEEWWNPSYLNSTLRAINQWNEAVSYFASNHVDFAFLLEARIIPQVSNETSGGFDAYITWIEQFGNQTCEAGLTRTTFGPSNVVANTSITFSVQDCRGNILSEVDMQNVAIHELGHGLGLSHANYTEDAMYFAYTLSSPVRAISTLDAYGVANVFRWLGVSQDFDPSNQGATVYSVTLPEGIEFDYLPISEENLPPRSTIDQIRTFVDDFLKFITQPEVLILTLLAISSVAAYLVATRGQRKIASQTPSSTQTVNDKKDHYCFYDHFQIELQERE